MHIEAHLYTARNCHITVYQVAASKAADAAEADDAQRVVIAKAEGDKLVEFGCEDIELAGMELDDDNVKKVLDALMQGKFTRVKRIILVSCDVVFRGIEHT